MEFHEALGESKFVKMGIFYVFWAIKPDKTGKNAKITISRISILDTPTGMIHTKFGPNRSKTPGVIKIFPKTRFNIRFWFIAFFGILCAFSVWYFFTKNYLIP